ncbi:MAG: FMN-binding protein [Gudongella sp.]|nr:FMN-binding protein [Gudongella sp.]
MKKRWKILLGILAVFVIAAVGMMMYLQSNLNNLIYEEIVEADLQNMEDGQYIGEYSSPPVSAKVQVELKDGIIRDIVILDHGHGQGEPAEIIVEDVIAQQRIDVDSIAGATYSSRVILRAVEDALKGN